MPRLPDIRTESWLEDQQKRFQEATASTWDALEFQLGARQQEAEIPPDYDAVGGMDQWEETEKNLLADTYRAQQKAWEEQQRQEEEKRQQEITAQAEQYRQQQQQAEAQAAQAQQAQDSQQQQQSASMMDMIRSMGIPTPGDAFEGLQNFMAPRDPNSSTGAFDVSAPPQQQQAPQSPTEAFNQFAGGMQTDAFGAPTPDPTQQQPDHTSSTGLLDRLGSAVRSVPGLIAETPDQALTAPANRYFSPTEKERETIGRGVEAATTFEPLERVSVPFTGREVEIPEAAQPYLGAAAGGLEALNAVTDYGRARVDPRTWTFAKDGIAREIFSPEETARWQYLFDPKDEQGFRRPGKLSPEESAELARYDQRINDRYQEIKNDPDEITRLANSSPLYQAVSMASDIPLGIAAGGTASRAAATAARGLGAGARTARAAGYAADVAAQTAFDPSTPFIQPAADVALRGVGAGVRGTRSLAGRAGEALLRSADEIPEGAARLGSGVVPEAEESRRFYHGTAGEFGRPDPGKFDEDGLFGPGYYLTSDPRVASSYAETRGRGAPRGWSNVGGEDPEPIGANVRAIDVPRGLNLLNLDEPLTPEQFRRILEATRKAGFPDSADELQAVVDMRERAWIRQGRPENIDIRYPTGEHLHEDLAFRLNEDYQTVVDSDLHTDKPGANRILRDAGYDGLVHTGGKRMPLRADDGTPIEHDVTIVFPESLDKIRNAFSGEAGGSGVVPRVRAPLFNAAQGGVFGAASENLEAQQEGREVDPATQLQRTLIGGGLGMLAGSRGARRLAGRTLQRLGSGVVPEGGATDPAPMIRLIRQMREAGASDDVIASAERDLAQKTDLTLDAIQQQTRGTADDVPPWEPTAAERAEVARQDAEIAGRPAHGGYLPEDEVDVAEAGPSPTPYSGGIGRSPPGSTPYDRGLTADEARQLQIPGFEDVPEDVRPAGQNIRGYGNLPRPTRPPPGYLSREGEEFVRENIGPSDKLTRAQREQWAAELIDTDIERLRELQANPPDPVQAGIDQTALRMLTQDPVEYLVEAQRELQRLKEVVRRSDGPVPKDIAIEIATWQNEMALRATQAKMALGAASANVRASSKVLNAQKGAYEGAALVEEAQRADAVGKAAKAASKTAQKIAKDAAGTVTDDDIKVLKEAADVMEVPGNKRAMTRKPRTAAGEEGEGGTGRTRKPAAPKEPKEETLAERLGRLQLRMTRMEDTGAEVAERSALQSELDEVTRQIWERADEALGARLSATRAEPTAAEAERLINEAVGRRFQRRVEGELRKSAPKTETPMQQAIKREIDRVTRSESWVQAAYDKQIRRRVDGELAREGRATVRAEVKDLAQAAQIWAKRIRQMPEQREALGEEFNQILQRMRQHSDAGKRVADDLAERLDVNLQEDVYQRGFRESYQASRATEEASIQSVVDRIRDIQNNARGPEVHLRIAELYKELDEIGGAGIQKGSDLRRQANTRGILKSGLSMTEENYDAVVKLLEDVDPSKPETMKPILALMRQPNWLDVLNEISYVNLLSNPLTHLTNITSTGDQAILRTFLRNPLKFVGSGGYTKGQVAAVKGLRSSIPEGWDLAKTTMKTGINPRRLEEAVAKGEYQHIGREHLPEIMEERGLWNLGIAKKAGGKMGEALHMMSTRPLAAMDAMLGHMQYTSAIWEKAQQRADDILRAGGDELDDLGAVIKRGSKKPVREQLANHIINNVWDYPEIIKEAGKIEDYTLFRTNRGPKTGVDLKVSNTLRSLSAWKNVDRDAPIPEKLLGLLANFVLPFQDVPYNFTKQGLGNVVGGPVGAVGFARAAAKGDRAEMGEQFARAGQGALMMTVPILLARNGDLTGPGPSDAAQRRMWLENHKPNSWRLPYTDTWISYEGTPWAIPFSTVAGVKEAWEFGKPKEGESDGAMVARYVGAGIGGAARGAASQSLVEPFMRNFEILGDQASENNIAQFLASTASRYSPHDLIAPVGSGMLGFLAGLADTVDRDPGRARSGDDVLPVARDVAESRLPILRNRLPERRGAYGEILEKPRLRGFLGYQGEASMPNDPITQHLEKAGVGIPTVPEEITYSGGKIPITIKEQQRFQQYYGEEMRAYMEAYNVGQEPYTPDELITFRSRARKMAQDRILNEMGGDEVKRRWREDLDELVVP